MSWFSKKEKVNFYEELSKKLTEGVMQTLISDDYFKTIAGVESIVEEDINSHKYRELIYNADDTINENKLILKVEEYSYNKKFIINENILLPQHILEQKLTEFLFEETKKIIDNLIEELEKPLATEKKNIILILDEEVDKTEVRIYKKGNDVYLFINTKIGMIKNNQKK